MSPGATGGRVDRKAIGWAGPFLQSVYAATRYFGYFGVPAYYSYDLGSWHMISLDSECSAGGVGGCQPWHL
jgi:hypothetical protein